MILLAADAWMALLDQSHARHAACVRALKDAEEPLATVWPVVAEVMTSAPGSRAQDVVWETITRGAIRLLGLDESDVAGMRDLMRRYSKQRMTVSEAALVHVADRDRLRTVLAASRRLDAFRAGGRRLKVLP